jgi:hypothetical protein
MGLSPLFSNWGCSEGNRGELRYILLSGTLLSGVELKKLLWLRKMINPCQSQFPSLLNNPGVGVKD